MDDRSTTHNPNNTVAPFPVTAAMVKGACLVALSLLGASFNTFMIVAIVPNRRLRTVRNILLVHLGGVGLISSIFTTMYPALGIFHGNWVGGKPMCQTYAYVTCVFTSVSVWTIAALSWDKYQTIASPLHHSLTATIRKMLPCFLLFWACGLILSLPPFFGANEFIYHKTMGTCGVNYSSTAGRWYTCVLVCLSFIFPFCLMIYCYAHIFRIARTQSSRIAATMLRMVSVIQAPIAPSTQSSLSLRGTKAMGTILQLIGSFVLTYLPFAIIILYEVIFATSADTIFVSLATVLFLAAPFTHAAIYGIRNQILRTSFYRYARRRIQHCCHQDKRRGSVKYYAQPKSSTNIRVPMKCLGNPEGQNQYLLRRTISYHGAEAHNNSNSPLYNNNGEFVAAGANTLPRPHSFDVLRHNINGDIPSPSTEVVAMTMRTAAADYDAVASGGNGCLDGHGDGRSRKNSKVSTALSSQVAVHRDKEGGGAGIISNKGVSNTSEKHAHCSSTDPISASIWRKKRERWGVGYSDDRSFFSKDISHELSMIDKEMDEISRYDDLREDSDRLGDSFVMEDNPSMTVLIDSESVFRIDSPDTPSHV